jgi:hypothetical protein
VLGRAPGVSEVAFDDARLLVSPTGTVLELDARAGVLWQLFDGHITLGELIDDVVAVYGAPRHQVAADLEQMVVRLHRSGMLATGTTTGVAATTTTTDPRHVDLPRSPCDCDFRDVEWRPGFTLAVDGRHLGVRTNLPALDEAVRSLLAHRLVDDAGAPPNVSLVHRGTGVSGAPVLELWVQQLLACRSASAARIRRQLPLELVATAGRLPEPGAIWFDAAPVGTPAGVVLVAAPHRASLGFLAGALARRDLAVGPTMVALDPTTATVVIADLEGQHEAGAAARFDALWDWPHDGPDLLGPGRYPLRGIAAPTAPTRGPTPAMQRPQPAGSDDAPDPDRQHRDRLRHLLPVIGRREATDLDRFVPALSALAQGVPMIGSDDGDLLAWLDDALG